MAFVWGLPGFDATDDTNLWTQGTSIAPGATLAQDLTTVTQGGGRGTMKSGSGTSSAQGASYAASPAVIPTSGRASFYYYHDAALSSGTVSAKPVAIFAIENGSWGFALCTGNDEKLAISKSLTAGSITADAIGSTVLTTNTLYRICVTWNITSQTVNTINVYLSSGNTAFGAASSAEVTASNLTLHTTSGANALVLGIALCNTAGDIPNNVNAYFKHVYVDNDTSGADIGNVHVTAKLPNANNVNTFGTAAGNNPANRWLNVDERPLSTANGWGTSSTAQTENYGIQSAGVGDESMLLDGATQLGFFGWVLVAAGTGTTPTAAMQVNGTTISITISPANVGIFFWGGTAINTASSSASYPSTLPGIGVTKTAGTPTVALYECGVVIAFLAPGQADAATEAETLGTTAALPLSDSASTGDALSVGSAASVSEADAAALAQTISTAATPGLSDAASETDAATIAAAISEADSAAVAQSSTTAAALGLSDAAAVSESVSAGQAFTMSDAAAVANTETVSAGLGLADGASVADNAATAAPVPLTDAAGEAETLATAAPVAFTDAVHMSDAASPAAAIGAADSASAADGLSMAAALPVADAAGATESVGTAATLGLADGASVGQALVIQSGVQVPLTDAGTLAQTLGSAATFGVSDAATVTDALANPAEALALADAAAASNALAVSSGQSITLVDAATLAQGLSINALVLLSDVMGVGESLSMSAAISMADTGLVAEILSVAQALGLLDGGTFGEVISRTITIVLRDGASFADALVTASIFVGFPGAAYVRDALTNTATVADALTALAAIRDALTGTATVTDQSAEG